MHTNRVQTYLKGDDLRIVTARELDADVDPIGGRVPRLEAVVQDAAEEGRLSGSRRADDQSLDRPTLCHAHDFVRRVHLARAAAHWNQVCILFAYRYAFGWRMPRKASLNLWSPLSFGVFPPFSAQSRHSTVG